MKRQRNLDSEHRHLGEWQEAEQGRGVRRAYLGDYP